jgi:glycolate oxidase
MADPALVVWIGQTEGVSSLAADLARILGENAVLHEDAALRAYDCDAYTVDRSKPQAVVLPSSTDEVAKIVRYCVEAGVPYTVRGAGTGLSGGALAALGGVTLSTKRLNKILSVDPENRRLTAEAGVANKRISDLVRPYGLHFAPDPSSQTVSTLGGNIAENSGGPHTLKMGVTVQHIHALKMVTVDGEIEEFTLRGDGLDFLGVIVGSEGTMGVVTEATVRLTPSPKHVITALASFANVRDATESVAAIIASGTLPAALEMMDKGVLGALKAAFGLEYHPAAAALLLVECDGDNPQAVEAEMQSVREAFGRHAALEVQIAEDDAARAKLWVARKKGVGAMGRLAPSIVTHDGVIPRSELPEMLDFIYAEASAAGLGVANLFHAGDGNLHPCFYFDDRDPGQVERVIETGERIMRRCLELGGSVTGEHGIGVEKIDLMSEMFSPADLAVQGLVKSIFNPGDLCNPCKVLPNQKSCAEHRKRWRGVAW